MDFFHSELLGEKMDSVISKYKFKQIGGLNYCHDEGVAYQTDMRRSVPYDRPYFEKYILYEKTPMGRTLNRARVDAVKPWAERLKIIDVGIGCGTFIKYALGSDLDICGYDINPCAIHWLHKRRLFENPYCTTSRIMCYTFWDSLEHIPDPQKLFEKIEVGSFVFASLPIFENLDDVTKSRHYRPDEHYYYFTTLGFIGWMLKYNFVLKKLYNFEIECGRCEIKTFFLNDWRW
jgi:hypothetical protein